ncbi:glycosyltransferase [Leucobacter luti]|nr:glycosyltransferase [Leucobacter luti]
MPPELTPSDFVALNRQAPWRMLEIGSRVRSLDVLDDLAAAATAAASTGPLTWNELRARIDADGSRAQLLHMRIQPLIAGSLLACVIDQSSENLQRAEKIARTVLDQSGLWFDAAELALRFAAQVAAMTRSHELFAELERLPKMHPGVAHAIRTDFLRPRVLEEAREAGAEFTSDDALSFTRWWDSFNLPFVKDGLIPFALDLTTVESAQSVFAHITVPAGTTAELPVADQPLVSIVVPTYNPEESFLNTVSSLINQSWSRIEILVVDDCSTAGREYLDAAAALDPRVRIIEQKHNGGAYAARNRGLAAARGDFVGFQDADDLSHPKRIELQVTPLLQADTHIASMSRALRTLSSGELTYLGYLPDRINASSLIFRREPVLERLGQFDAVRKGADSEFTERLENAFGRGSVLRLSTKLGLVQLTSGSLSRADFRPEWMAAHRYGYIAQYRAAHRAIAASPQADWKLTADRDSISWSTPRMRGAAPRAHLSHAVLADWNTNLATPRASVEQALQIQAAEATTPVGLLSGFNPRLSQHHREYPSDRAAAGVEAGKLVWAAWGDATHIDALVVPDPEYLAFLPDPGETELTFGAVIIVLDETIRARTTDQLPPVEWCEERVRSRFGVDPQWRVSSPLVHAALKRRGVRAELAPPAHAGASVAGIPPRPRLGIPLPFSHGAGNWDMTRVTALLPDPAAAAVLFYDEAGRWAKLQLPPGARLVSGATHDRQAFISEVDVLAPDPAGQRSIAATSWLRLSLERGVPATLPTGVFSGVPDTPALRYDPNLGESLIGEGLNGFDYVPPLASDLQRIETANQAALASPPTVRFVVIGAGDEQLAVRTRLSIERLPSSHVAATVVSIAHPNHAALRALLAAAPTGTRVCLVTAGFEFEEDAFERLADSSTEDVHVFTESGYDYRLNAQLAGVDRVVAAASAPLWAGSTPLLIRAETLDHLLRERAAPPAADSLTFAEAVLLCGGFGVLGGARAPYALEDRAGTWAEPLSLNWYRGFLRAWTALLSRVHDAGAAGDYLQRVFVYLLATRLVLNTGHSPKLWLSLADRSELELEIVSALQCVDPSYVLEPGYTAQGFSRELRMHLLQLTHELTAESELRVGERGPSAVWHDLVLEQPAEVPVRIDSMRVEADELLIFGRYPLSFDYPDYELTLTVGSRTTVLPDQQRFADSRLFGASYLKARTFSARIPFSELTDRIEFRFKNTEVATPPLRPHFVRSTSRLSGHRGAYWAAAAHSLLSVDGSAIKVEPYSRARHLMHEVRKQYALLSDGDPVKRAAARLRRKYFLTRRRHRNRQIWMYADRIIKGGDNGEYAYRYAAAQDDGIEKHYVLRSGTPTAARFTSSGLQYLEFGNDAQRLAYLNAAVVFATRVAPANTFGFDRDAVHFRDLFHADIVYINHGLVVDSLEHVLNAGYSGFSKICVVSEVERRVLQQPRYGYDAEQVAVTGFARYDGLESTPGRTILLAPTWRSYLHTPQKGDSQSQLHETFKQTAYFKEFQALLDNPELARLLQETDYRLTFLLHPNTSVQRGDFVSPDPRIEVMAATDDVSYETLMSEAAIMVTDYSGVQFDFATMSKPIVYFQPRSIPAHYEGGVFSYEHDGFGPIAATPDDLVGLLRATIAQDGALAPEYRERIERFFAHLDRGNARRTYEVGRQIMSTRSGGDLRG